MFHGQAPSAFEATVNVQQRCGDGVNLYNYLGSNPLMHSDPTGLFFGDMLSGLDAGGGGGTNDPFDIVEDYIATSTASQAAFMERISGGFNTMAFVAAQVAQLYPPIGMGVAAYNIASGQGSFMDAVSLCPIGPAARLVGKIATEFTLAKGMYATSGVMGFAKKAANTRAGVWALGVGERGLAIETMLVERLPGEMLEAGFKTFDKWDQATATAYSIKSMNLGAPTYQNASAIASKISGYASQAASFTYGKRGQFKLLGN